MTFVVARRFGERIHIVSDTMISDSTKLRPDVIPGRLKAIPDAGIGYIYAPFRQDKPVEWRFSKPWLLSSDPAPALSYPLSDPGPLTNGLPRR
jgi:hypothetical protein